MTLSNFKKNIFELLKKDTQALVLLRIPNSGNSSRYFFLESVEDLENLIKNSNPSDSITVFKSINVLNSGIVTEGFIKTMLTITSTYSFDPELVVIADSYQQKENIYHEFAESINILEEILTDFLGTYVTLIKEPDFLNEENTFHIYFPDKNGISKPGHSY